MIDVDIWTGTATGYPDDDDPQIITTAWSVKEGVDLLDAQIIEGTMLILRVRVPPSIRVETP